MPVHLVLSPKREGLRRFCLQSCRRKRWYENSVAKTLALAEEMVKVGDDPERKRGNEASGRDRQDPGPHYPPGHAPFDC